MAFKTLMGALVALPLAATALADPGHSHGDVRAYGEPGNPKKTSRTVQVVMREADGKMEFVPSKIEIRRGEQIKFVLKNDGALDHELVIGTLEENLKHAIEMQKNPDMEHDDPNAKRLAPGKGGAIVWRFTKKGEFDFSCLIPGHREAGMSGTIVVK
ncbi:MAG: copper resistance protein [Rhizobiales bacterium 62-17]|nr:cupredoxin family protein [Hyphomicrobiales bacterium]OJY03912.1 MAG: copper resistance protein [Rhizobiales bacterium 62-17]